MKKVSVTAILMMATMIGACALQEEPPAAQADLAPEVCVKNDLTGLCPGFDVQIARTNAASDARALQPTATDIEVSHTCSHDDSGQGRLVTCVTKVTIAASTLTYLCQTLYNNDGSTAVHGCSSTMDVTITPTESAMAEYMLLSSLEAHGIHLQESSAVDWFDLISFLCKEDDLTGMCTGAELQFAANQSVMEAQAQYPAATDIKVNGGCTLIHGTQSTGGRCFVSLTVGNAAINLVCTVAIVNPDTGNSSVECSVNTD